MQLAKRSNITPSLTLAMNAKAKQMKAQGIDVISFAAGEPDFHTPDHVKEAGKKAIDDNKTYYTPDSGIPELKNAVAAKLRRDNGLEYTPEQVVINSGAKHSVFNVLSVLVDEGDEVIVPAPYWVSYSEMIAILGGKPVFIPTTEKTGFKISPADLQKAFSGRTKALIINSPNNPTGAVCGREELFACAELLERKDMFVISDEVYEKLVYDGRSHVSIATYSEKLRAKTVVVNGVSKAYSMTGWRIGYCAGPKAVIDAIAKLQGHTCGNPASISQYASLAALEQDAGFLDGWVKEFKKRRDYIVRELNGMEGVSCTSPEGAFYVFPNVSRTYGKTFQGTAVKDSMDMAQYLLEKGRIAVVPGKAFGADDYVRISFATSMDNIVEGMKRLKECLAAR
jgi:aspartate aminotransferase